MSTREAAASVLGASLGAPDHIWASGMVPVGTTHPPVDGSARMYAAQPSLTDGRMEPKVLVVGDSPALRDLVDHMLSGRAKVVWSRTPNETEGLDTAAVVLEGARGREDLMQVRVHPKLAGAPVIWVSGTDGDALVDVTVVDISEPDPIHRLATVLAETVSRSPAALSS